MLKKIIFLSLFILLFFSVKSYAHPYSVNECYDNISAQAFKTARSWGIRAVNNHPQSFYAHLCLGEADKYLGLYNPALNDFKTSIPLANDKNRLMLAYNWIGLTFDNVGDEKDALMYDFRSLKLARELNNTSGESGDISNIALIYKSEGKYQKAMLYYKKSLALKKSKKGKALSYNNIATVYAQMNNYPEAIKYETNALNLDESIGNYYRTAQDYLNLGALNTLDKNYVPANKDILKGLLMEKKIGNKNWIGVGYKYLGRLYRNEGNNKKAYVYYEKAYNMFKISGDASDAQDCLYMINKIKGNIQTQVKNSVINACLTELTKHKNKLALMTCKKAADSYPKSFYANLFYGRAYHNLGNYLPAINQFKLAVPFATSISRQAIIYNWIGGDYARIKNYKEGLFYLNKSLMLTKKLHNINDEIGDISFIKTIYYNEKNYKEDIYYSKQYASLLKNKKAVAGEYNRIGVLYYEISNYPKSIIYTEKAYVLNKNLKNYPDALIDILNTANSNVKLKKYAAAKKDILKGIILAKKSGNEKNIQYNLAYAYQIYGSYYKHLKNNDKAVLNYTKAYKLFNDIKNIRDAKYCLSMINKIKKQTKNK
jgi:tetratricopeptide (TPR) repeat protein